MPKQSDELLQQCPGLCGQLARIIFASTKRSQPSFALASALAFCASLKCGRIVSPEGIEPNLYTCIIADSGSGKSQVQSALNQIISIADIHYLLMGKPASDAAMLKALAQNPRKLLIWDEFGIALSELANSKTGCKALILGLLTDLFSAAGKDYLGKEYSTQSRTDIKSPYLNIFAASTSGRFFSSLNESFVEDGFLGRFLFFFGNEKAKKQKSCAVELAEEHLSAIHFLEEWETKKTTNNLARILELEKKIVTFESLELHKRWISSFDDLYEESSMPFERIFWSRGAELYIKICLAVCETTLVTSDDCIFAQELVEFCIASQIEQCKARLGETSAERERDKFIALIKPGEELTRAEISRRAWRLKIPLLERRILIDELVQNEIWIETAKHLDDSQKLTKFYSRNPKKFT